HQRRATARTPTTGRARQWRLRRRSEEHTSELQSLAYLVCRLLLEKKKQQKQRQRLAQSRLNPIRDRVRPRHELQLAALSSAPVVRCPHLHLVSPLSFFFLLSRRPPRSPLFPPPPPSR